MLPVDYAMKSEVRAIIDVPDEIDVTLDSFSPLLPLLPDLTKSWYASCKVVLEARVKECLNVAECDDPLSLAVSYFYAWSPCTYSRYPEILAFWFMHSSPYHGEDPYLKAIRQQPGGGPTNALNIDRLSNLKLARHMTETVRLFGGDPLTTTYEEIVKFGVAVRCILEECQAQDPTCMRMSWDEAVSGLPNRQCPVS